VHQRTQLERVRFVARPKRTTAVGALIFGLFVSLALAVPQGPLTIEQRWAEWMLHIQTPVLTDIARVFNVLGRGVGIISAVVVTAVVLLIARRWWALSAFAITEGVTQLVTALVKASLDRTRPPDGLVHVASATTSFPSGHTSFAAATSVAFVLLFTRPGSRRRWWPPAAAATALMAWSRTYLQVHWLLDVIGGALLGIGVALAAFGAVQLVAER
jgi:undecaprenyl-diphosphatase